MRLSQKARQIPAEILLLQLLGNSQAVQNGGILGNEILCPLNIIVIGGGISSEHHIVFHASVEGVDKTARMGRPVSLMTVRQQRIKAARFFAQAGMMLDG